MGPPGLINLLIYAVCSVFVTTHTTPVPVHSLERPPTNIVHGNQYACSLPMQDQQETMQFTPLNALSEQGELAVAEQGSGGNSYSTYDPRVRLFQR